MEPIDTDFNLFGSQNYRQHSFFLSTPEFSVLFLSSHKKN
jgi:hypothetical protein